VKSFSEIGGNNKRKELTEKLRNYTKADNGEIISEPHMLIPSICS
jgi:hypothetical protein